MTFNNLNEFKNARDLAAKKRDFAKHIVDKIYDEEMQVVLNGLFDLQRRCKHPRMEIIDTKYHSSRKCPDCDYFTAWGSQEPPIVNNGEEIKTKLKSLLAESGLI